MSIVKQLKHSMDLTRCKHKNSRKTEINIVAINNNSPLHLSYIQFRPSLVLKWDNLALHATGCVSRSLDKPLIRLDATL
jgi:hypothetical protein